LTIYYLFKMGAIVNRIVNTDAPATTLAEQISVEMGDIRRTERNYFLLQDPASLQATRQSLDRVKQLATQIGDLEPDEKGTIEEVLKNIQRYDEQFASAVLLLKKPGATTAQRVREAVTAYEGDLNRILQHSKRIENTQLLKELQAQLQSFDSELSKTLEEENPVLRAVTPELQSSSENVLQAANYLEKQAWAQVERDHQEARHLIYRAEWMLSIVSAITFVLSVWISFVLPKQVVKPLVRLRQAVDHAASGHSPVEFQFRGEGEVIELARSIDNLLKRFSTNTKVDVRRD
jgi:methyl-accepting chemotaxis protein